MLLEYGELSWPDTVEFVLRLVRFDGHRVEIEITSVTNPTQGAVLFQLVNNDNDTG